MARLVDFLQGLESFRSALAQGQDPLVHFGAPSFTHSYLAAGFLAREPWSLSPVLVVAPNQDLAEELRREISLYLPERRVLLLPPRGVWYGPEAEVPRRVAGLRAQALDSLSATVEQASVVVVDAATLMERARPGLGSPFSLRVGDSRDFERLIVELVELGYERVDQVEEGGEFSVRGGLIDVFPATDVAPVRIEFWGDDVESIRRFSVFSQRSLGSLEAVELDPAAEDEESDAVPISSLLPVNTRVLLVDPARMSARAEAFAADLEDVFGEGEGRSFYLSWLEVEAALAAHPRLVLSGATEAEIDLRATSGELAVTTLPEAERNLETLVQEGYRVVVAFEQRAEAERAGYILRRVTGRVAGGEDVLEAPGITFLAVPHHRHFLIPQLKLALLTDAQLFPKRRKATSERRLIIGAELSSFRDLRKGDYVVHEDHGVGRFEGMSTKIVAGVTRDYLDLAFRDSDMLYIPHDQIQKVSRYVGPTGAPPALSKLGGRAWDLVKNRARRAVREMAGELLQLYAMRQTAKGFTYSEDGEWQRRFEGAFPYDETQDQLRAIDAVKDDMESESPMDRLICGDVGYGKTEVALRAAFKAVMDGKQVMMLVPTTILAQQHFGTFRERFAEYPVKVEMISRFRSPREQRQILKDFSEGRVDLLVGTHRLLSKDVRPKDLGLVIVDEEQRFGVTQKEALRRLKLRVDVITLTATPIPRTLQMSLAGVRDISVIETPPRDRHPIQTYVGLYDEGMVKRAIEREIGRGGQVFYLHNRVESIDKTAARLQELMPAVRLAVAHGQMQEQQLERVMLEFLRGDADVLVTTTIIESGLDIPNANTLVVERADLLGLAQLYQIRGRIGRSTRVAHAFLFHPDEAVLTEEAMARLSTLADYTELGSGFKIAMRDLEIRGAGNLLGDEQSGHIAAVGFEMYLSMLHETVESMQGHEAPPERVPRVEVGVSAYVPASFIGYEAAKVDLHRRIAAAGNREELAGLREELGDRFGGLPEAVDNLIFLGEVRVALQMLKAESLTVRAAKLTMTGLFLPKGGREALRLRDQRYVYSPTSGVLSLTFRGEMGAGAASERGDGEGGDELGAGLRGVVERVLDDILHVWLGAVHAA